jgi:hypothetical protein
MAPGSTAPGPLDQWYETAGVRRGVRRGFRGAAESGRVFFPDRLVPHLKHPLVAALDHDSRERLRLLQLYQFLLATTHMETRVVNVGAERIANGRCGLDLPVSMRMDAFKVYCDEGYHALYSLDLADQISRATGVALPSWGYGAFVDRLAQRGRDLLPDEPELSQLLQVVVFETLITAVLNEAPAEPDLEETVRAVLRDHAKDEGRHHRFFSAFFHELWAGLDATLRRRVAAALPELIRLCVTADTIPVRSALLSAGLDDVSADQVVYECYDITDNPGRLMEIARGTVSMCRSAGVLDTPGGCDAFVAGGLITAASC